MAQPLPIVPDFNLDTNGAAPPPPPKMVKMELIRHYVPKGDVNAIKIVGYQRAEKKTKDSAGNERVVVEAAFIDGEMFPPAHAGVGYPGKVWAGTVIEVPEAEAKEMRRLKIADAYL